MFIIYTMCGHYIPKCYLPSSVLYLGMENWDCSGSAFLLAAWCYYSTFLFQCFFSLISPFSFHPGKITQFNDNDKRINGQHIQCMGNVGTVYMYVAYGNCNWLISFWTATGRTTCTPNLWLPTYFLLSPVSAQNNVCPGVLYNIVHDYTQSYNIQVLTEPAAWSTCTCGANRFTKLHVPQGHVVFSSPTPNLRRVLGNSKGEGELTLQPRFSSNCRKTRHLPDTYIKAWDLKTFPSH